MAKKTSRRQRSPYHHIMVGRKGVSVVGRAGDWYVEQTTRTGMWTWTTPIVTGPFEDRQEALDYAMRVDRSAPVPWDGGGDEIIERASRRTGSVGVGESRRNPLKSKKSPKGKLTEGEWAMVGVGVAVIGAVVYAVYKTQSAASNVSASTTNAANQLSPVSQLASAAQTAQQSVADTLLGGNFQGATSPTGS